MISGGERAAQRHQDLGRVAGDAVTAVYASVKTGPVAERRRRIGCRPRTCRRPNAVVKADANDAIADLALDRCTRATRPARRVRHRRGAQVHVEILDLCRPVSGKRRFNTGAEGPAGSGLMGGCSCCREGRHEDRQIVIDAGKGPACGHV